MGVGKLFEPRDPATNDLVLDYAYGIKNDNYNFWHGIDDIDTVGTFQYTTGGNLAFTNWEVGQPGNVPNHHCVHSTPRGVTWKGKWDNYICDTKYSSICELI